MSDILAGAGKCYAAPYGTDLPSTVAEFNTALDEAFIDLGEISEDGLESAFSVDKTVIRNWKGVAIRALGSQVESTFKLTFLDTNRPVLEQFYGAEIAANGLGGVESKIVLGQPHDKPYALVIPVIDPSTGRTKVYTLPRVEVAERGDITDKPDETGYELTYQALYDDAFGSAGAILSAGT